MHITNSFVVPVSVERAWDALLDVERVAPCMPGAALTSFDGEAFTGTVAVKLGALSMKYQGSGKFLQRDEDNRRVSFEAKGRETRGSGTAAATVHATLHPDGSSTRVEVDTELNIGGRAAQFGRSVMSDVAGKLLEQFASSLADELGGTGRADAPSDAVAPAPRSPAGEMPPAHEISAGAKPAAHREVQPIDLAQLGRQVMLKRAVVLAATGVVLLALVRRIKRSV